MADISITAANVVAGSGANVVQGVAGATLAAGEIVYKDSADSNSYKLADNDGAAATKEPIGMALNGAADGQPVRVLIGGAVTVGAVLTAGVAYYLSGTPGKICPVADVTTGDDPILVGIAASTSVLNFGIADPDVTL